jgi:hypothetical protein
MHVVKPKLSKEFHDENGSDPCVHFNCSHLVIPRLGRKAVRSGEKTTPKAGIWSCDGVQQ